MVYSDKYQSKDNHPGQSFYLMERPISNVILTGTPIEEHVERDALSEGVIVGVVGLVNWITMKPPPGSRAAEALWQVGFLDVLQSAMQRCVDAAQFLSGPPACPPA
jgi:hypothetical protein